MKRGAPFAQAKVAAVQEAERKARDQVLLQAMDQTFPNGVTLEDAAVADPFVCGPGFTILLETRRYRIRRSSGRKVW